MKQMGFACVWTGPKKNWICNTVSSLGKVCHANKYILKTRALISQRLRYFDSIVSSAACFACGQHTLHEESSQVKSSQVKSSQVKSSRVSPNALRRTLPGHSNNISSPHSSLDGKIRALATHAAKRLQCPKQH